MPRSRLATIQRRIAPLLQFDVVGVRPFKHVYLPPDTLFQSLPTEVALQIFSYLQSPTLLVCGVVSRRWQTLANDQSLWKTLCQTRGWTWRHAPRVAAISTPAAQRAADWDDSDDEGMGDSDEEDSDEDEHPTLIPDSMEAAKAELTLMQAELDSGFASMSLSFSSTGRIPTFTNTRGTLYASPTAIASSSKQLDNSMRPKLKAQSRYSAPSTVPMPAQDTPSSKPDYKLLHQTHSKLRNRFLSSSYKLSALQTRGAPTNAHTNTIYCLQLYTYPETDKQVLFTGSRDKTVREWNLATGMVERVIANIHTSSVLSLCVHNGYLASAGSDRQVVVWHLGSNRLVNVLCDHEDSVLCVRFDDKRLVSCSKGALQPILHLSRRSHCVLLRSDG